MTDQPTRSVEVIDPLEFAAIHCDALHSSTHPPLMARPCAGSTEQASILADAWNTRRGGYVADSMGTAWSRERPRDAR